MNEAEKIKAMGRKIVYKSKNLIVTKYEVDDVNKYDRYLVTSRGTTLDKDFYSFVSKTNDIKFERKDGLYDIVTSDGDEFLNVEYYLSLEKDNYRIIGRYGTGVLRIKRKDTTIIKEIPQDLYDELRNSKSLNIKHDGKQIALMGTHNREFGDIFYIEKGTGEIIRA
jgi:hypothetical protein